MLRPLFPVATTLKQSQTYDRTNPQKVLILRGGSCSYVVRRSPKRISAKCSGNELDNGEFGRVHVAVLVLETVPQTA